MHMPSSIQVPSWSPLLVIAHLAERTTIQMQHATRFPVGFPTWKRGMHKMLAWSEHLRPRRAVRQRLLLSASVSREGITDISDLITLMSATFTLLRCPFRGSPQGER